MTDASARGRAPPFPVAGIASLGARDVSGYAAMLARQLSDNAAISHRALLGLRWLASPFSDYVQPERETFAWPETRDKALILTGSQNYTTLGGFAIDPSIDTIRIDLERAGLDVVGLSYARPSGPKTYLRHNAPIDAAIAPIRRRAARDGLTNVVLGPAHRDFTASVASMLKMPRMLVASWFDRQLGLLAASRSFFANRWDSAPPEALFCHGGLNFLTSGAKVAAYDAGIPAFEVQHGALSLLDPLRDGSPLGRDADEQAITWLAHGTSGAEIVVGPPAHRLHNWLSDDDATLAELIPAAIREAYRAAIEIVTAQPRAMPVVLIARQKAGDELNRARVAGLSLAHCELWDRQHPRLARAPAVQRTGFDPTALPLGALLAHTDWVLSGHSSVAVEAAAFGAEAAFLSSDGALLYPGIEGSPEALARFPERPEPRRRLPVNVTSDWIGKLRSNGWRAAGVSPSRA